MGVNPGCCMVCGKKIKKQPSGVQIQLQIAGAESWPVTWLLLCKEHAEAVYEAVCWRVWEKANEMKEAGE